jgi:sialate O-acetylesterase
MHSILLVLWIVICATSAEEPFRLARYYGDNMVLQRAPHNAIIWGFASQTNATITLRVRNKTYSTRATSTWTIKLDPMLADGQPTDIVVTQTSQEGVIDTIRLTNVLFGDVWCCFGQSNMEMRLKDTFGWDQESEKITDFVNVRIFRLDPEWNALEEKHSSLELDDLLSPPLIAWSAPTSAFFRIAAGSFSAVCWYFGKELNKKLKVPIGLVQATFGGTTVQHWMPREPYNQCEQAHNQTIDLMRQMGLAKEKPSKHSSKWPVLVHPLTLMSIFGIIMYQGESDVQYKNHLYNCTFPALIASWRREWFERTNRSTDPSMPFGFVQLQSVYGGHVAIPWLRFHQTASYGYVPNPDMPNVFSGTAIDLAGENPNSTTDPSYFSIHSRHKADVGKRMALGALNLAYGVATDFAAPRVASIEFKDPEIRIEFASQSGYRFQIKVFHDKGFEVCCDSDQCEHDQTQDWRPLRGIRFLDSINGVRQSSRNYSAMATFTKPSGCHRPAAIRYLWRAYACGHKDCPLYSSSQLPITPFIYSLNNATKLKLSKATIPPFRPDPVQLNDRHKPWVTILGFFGLLLVLPKIRTNRLVQAACLCAHRALFRRT